MSLCQVWGGAVGAVGDLSAALWGRRHGLRPLTRRLTRFMECQRDEDGLFGLDVGSTDHLAPLLDILDDVVAELGRRPGKRLLAQVDKARFHFRISESGVDCLVE